jgi:hypothetical protein
VADPVRVESPRHRVRRPDRSGAGMPPEIAARVEGGCSCDGL